jgi:hypothetical protein
VEHTAHRKQWDVIVVGGGVSGVTAATAAARNGAATLLVEKDACLGGTMTTCLVGPMMTFHSYREQVIGGLAQEIVDHLMAMHASPGHILDTSGYVATITPFDSEALKLVAQRLVLQAGAQVLYHSTVVGVVTSGALLQGVVVQHKGGRETLTARVVIDASGDADVAFRCGVPCEYGRSIDGLVQPVSLMFKLSGWDKAAFTAYVLQHPEVLRLGSEGVAAYAREPLVAVCGFVDSLQSSIARGQLPLRREHVLFFNTQRPDEVIVNMSRVMQVDVLDPWALSSAETLAREQIFAILDFLRRDVPGFSGANLISSGARVGIRESRRIVGDYMLTARDVLSAARFPDAIARSAYPIDIHALAPDQAGDYDRGLPAGQAYDIPYRCLLPQKVDGLLVAGRCISTTVEAHASTRVSPTCMAFGQAAGTAAALAARKGLPPRQVDIDELRQVLVRQGALLS